MKRKVRSDAVLTPVTCPVCGTTRTYTRSLAARRKSCGDPRCTTELRRRNAAAQRRPWHERFARYVRVRRHGCWEWTGPLTVDGYGQLHISKIQFRAHRLSYIIHKGPIPDGLFVCHKCDNPACVRPGHLYAGTHKQNMRDKRIRGRSNTPVGSDNGQAKLTEGAVAQIKKMLAGGHAQCEIAKSFGVDPSLVSKIKHGVVWGHVA